MFVAVIPLFYYKISEKVLKNLIAKQKLNNFLRK